LINLAKGIEIALEEYYAEINSLEQYCSENERTSLSYVYNALQLKLPVLVFLRNLIMEIQVRKLQGCAMLHNLHQQSEHGDLQLERVIRKQVYIRIFLFIVLTVCLFQNYEAC